MTIDQAAHDTTAEPNLNGFLLAHAGSRTEFGRLAITANAVRMMPTLPSSTTRPVWPATTWSITTTMRTNGTASARRCQTDSDASSPH